jgi:hypothetical protein
MTDLTLCSNTACDIRISCERGRFLNAKEVESVELFNQGKTDGTTCPDFILRTELDASKDPDMVHRHSRKRGRRHNAHAPPRAAFTGSQDLFGISLTGKGKPAKKEPRPKLSIKRPDLMVSRHIRDGRNINTKQEDD